MRAGRGCVGSILEVLNVVVYQYVSVFVGSGVSFVGCALCGYRQLQMLVLHSLFCCLGFQVVLRFGAVQCARWRPLRWPNQLGWSSIQYVRPSSGSSSSNSGQPPKAAPGSARIAVKNFSNSGKEICFLSRTGLCRSRQDALLRMPLRRFVGVCAGVSLPVRFPIAGYAARLEGFVIGTRTE